VIGRIWRASPAAENAPTSAHVYNAVPTA